MFRFILQKIFILFFPFCFLNINAQEEQLRFKSITTENGLSNNFVTCIIQDSYGFMWFGSEEGLNKFNGYETEVFKQKLNDPKSLSDNRISVLYTDSKNRLWIGTYNGLNLYDYEHDFFKKFNPPAKNRDISTCCRITGIFEDNKHNVCFSTEMGILYSIVNEHVVELKKFEDYHYIKSCILDKNGNIWFGDIKGVVYYNLKTKELKNFQYFETEKGKEKIGMISVLYEDGETIWAGSNTGQLLSINKNDFSIRKYFKNNSSLNYIFDIKKDSKGLLYVGSNEGLYVINIRNGIYHFYNHQPYDKDGLNASTVSYIYFDNSLDLWLGTVQGGTNYCIKSKEFTNFNLYSKPFNLDISSIQSLLVDHKGNWWLGSYNKGINIINPKNGEKQLFLPQQNDPYSLTQSSVMNIFEDHKKRIWTSSYYGYLLQYNPNNQHFTPFDFNHLTNGYKEVTDIRSITEDKHGNLWFISHGFGLFKFNPETKEVKFYTRDLNRPKYTLSDDYAFQVLNQHDSILWIGTPTGVSKFNIEKESFYNYFKSADSTSLSHNYVNMIYIDSEENIWVGTFFGLNLLDKKTNRFYHYFENDGLASNQIKSIIEEKPGKLWLATGEGLSSMEYDINSRMNGKLKVKFRNYSRYDNIQDKFFWERSVAKTADGLLIFGSESGVVAFYPSQIKDNTQLPKIFLTDLYLFNNKVKIGDFDSILKVNIINTKEIVLNYSENIFGFKYVALNYLSTEKNQYAYKMIGFDKDWNFVGGKREATYTNLNPGTYIFKVIASNNDGYWNTEGISIKVKVLPPFWKTWWFRILIVISLILLVAYLYYFTLSFYRKQQKKLEDMVKERTMDLGETTVKLEERQEEINQQREELIAQHEALYEANEKLKEHQEKILEQNKELFKHRNELESLIEQRTHELNVAKERAEESDRLKSSFLANLSHEIRTPLNAIMGFSNLVTEEKNLSEKEKLKYNQIIQNSGLSLLYLIDDIIDFSKIESGHINIVLKEVPLQKILENISQIFEFQLNRQKSDMKRNIEFKVITNSNIHKLILMTDEIRLNQVLTNLINNAIKFTYKGSIEIGYSFLEDKKNVEFYVKDTGIGIKKENQHIIFQRFRKIEDKQSEIHRGAGLGLAITKQLVQLLGGSIRVDSEPQKGSTFYFTIPVEVQNRLKYSVYNSFSTNKLPDLQDHTIIIAEDDDANYEFLEKIMKKTKCKILRAINGREVLSYLEKNEEISLILMDIKMPVLNGIETLKEIRSQQIIVPVIAQTAYALSDEVRELKAVGFDEYITKPIIIAELYAKINKIVKI